MITRVLVLLLVLAAPGFGFAQTQLQPPQLLGPGGGGSAACNDGQDNDGDGVKDYPGDAGCSSPSDTSESGDNTVIVTADISGTDLNTCINGSDVGGCKNMLKTAGSATTVCGGASGATNCSSPQLRKVTGGWKTTRTNVAVNSLAFSGVLTINQNAVRIVSSTVNPGIGTEWTADDFVIHNSKFDAGYNASNGTCGMQQMFVGSSNGGRITNNSFVNICPTTTTAGQDHGEAFFVQQGTTNLYIAENYWSNNGGTSHLFFTEWAGGDGDEPQHVCVKNNEFDNRWKGSYNDASIRQGTIIAPTTIYFDPSNHPTPGRSQGGVDYQGACQNSACSSVESQPRTCKQCLDGIDNDGDGLIDLWDPGCANGSDDSE